MSKWLWWGGGAAVLAYVLFKKEESSMRARVTWSEANGAPKSRDFEKLEVARAFADALTAAGARGVQTSPLT